MTKKINLIIDSDTGNDVDDAFAIAYAFSHQEIFNIEAVTIAPFIDKVRHVSARDSIIEGSLEASRILRYIGVKKPDLIFKGSEGFVTSLYNKTSPAVDKIIELAKKEEVTIACLGPLTNIAIALTKAPEIKNNISIVWFGTRHTFVEEFTDTNYKTDKKAFEIVAKSGVLMTVIPSYVGKFIVTSKYEFERNVAVNDVGRYLLSKIKSSSQVSESDLGIKTLYDVAPIAYLINRDWFKVKAISINSLLKEQSKVSMGMLVNYVYDMAPNQLVWRDFVENVTKYGNEVSPAQIFFTSDTHLGILKGYRLRMTPFDRLSEYDDEIVARWNKVVSDKDIVYHIGDFGKYEFVKKLKGQIILICGNYEKKDFRDFDKFRTKLIELGFKDVIRDGAFLEQKIDGNDVYMTHKPTDCREGCFNLYGHVHDLKPLKKNGFNVCTTYHNFTPVSFEEVKKYLIFIKKQSDADVFVD